MANTYTLIASNTLSSSAASVTFSSIPNTYTDLVLKFSAKTSGSDTYGGFTVYLQFNNDSSALYSTRDLFATYDGSSNIVASSGWSSETSGRLRYAGERTNPTDVFSNSEIYVPSYTASQNKPFSFVGVLESNSSNIDGINTTAGLYRSTSAITQVKLSPAGRDWTSGSSFFLYGIQSQP